MFTSLYAKLIGIALAVLAAWYAVDTVAGAFRDRKALTAQVAALNAAVKAANAERDSTAAAANAELDRLHKDAMLRDELAKQAKEREAAIQTDLSHAQHTIAEWKRTADENARRCFDLPLPAGLFHVPEQGTAAPAAGNPHRNP